MTDKPFKFSSCDLSIDSSNTERVITEQEFSFSLTVEIDTEVVECPNCGVENELLTPGMSKLFQENQFCKQCMFRL